MEKKRSLQSYINRSLFARSRSFWYGLTLPYRAARLIIRNKTLLFLSLIPLLLTFVLSIYVVGRIKTMAQAALTSLFVSWGMEQKSVLFVFVQGIEWVLLFVLGAVLFMFLSSLVASPFNDYLAEKTEPLCTPPLPTTPKISLLQQIRLIGMDLVKTLATLTATLLTFVLALIPLLNLITLTATMLLIAFQFVTYPQTRRGIRFRESLLFLRRYFFACLGFGMSLAVLFSIPFLSSLALPVAVVGGTLLFGRAQGLPDAFRLK